MRTGHLQICHVHHVSGAFLRLDPISAPHVGKDLVLRSESDLVIFLEGLPVAIGHRRVLVTSELEQTPGLRSEEWIEQIEKKD